MSKQEPQRERGSRLGTYIVTALLLLVIAAFQWPDDSRRGLEGSPRSFEGTTPSDGTTPSESGGATPSELAELAPVVNWTVRVLVVSVGLLTIRSLSRRKRRLATGEPEKDVELRWRWYQGALSTAFIVLFLLPVTYMIGPVAPASSCVARGFEVLALVTGFWLAALWVIQCEDQLWRRLDGDAWRNVLPNVYFSVLSASWFLVPVFAPLGAISIHGFEEIHVDWRILGTFLVCALASFLLAPPMTGWLLRLETAPDDKLLGVMKRHEGRYASCAILRTFGSKLANAIAFLPGRRIVVTETLVDELSETEVDAVVCHELGHLARRSEALLRLVAGIAWPTLLFLVFAATPWCLSGIGSAGGNPVLAAVILVGVLLIIVGIGTVYARYSRDCELFADRFALEHCLDPDAYASALVKIHRLSGIPETFEASGKERQTHPSLKTRLEAIREWERERERAVAHNSS